VTRINQIFSPNSVPNLRPRPSQSARP
jgi:hypothetical protein